MSIRSRLNNIEKTTGATAEADKPIIIIRIADGIYTIADTDFTGTEEDYNDYKTAHSINDSNSIMLYLIQA